MPTCGKYPAWAVFRFHLLQRKHKLKPKKKENFEPSASAFAGAFACIKAVFTENHVSKIRVTWLAICRPSWDFLSGEVAQNNTKAIALRITINSLTFHCLFPKLNCSAFFMKTWRFVGYSTYIFKSNCWNLKRLFIQRLLLKMYVEQHTKRQDVLLLFFDLFWTPQIVLWLHYKKMLSRENEGTVSSFSLDAIRSLKKIADDYNFGQKKCPKLKPCANFALNFSLNLF